MQSSSYSFCIGLLLGAGSNIGSYCGGGLFLRTGLLLSKHLAFLGLQDPDGTFVRKSR